MAGRGKAWLGPVLQMKGKKMELLKYPDYKQAASDANAEFTYGQIITHDWLYHHFKLPQPESGTFTQIQKWNFDFMTCMDGFREILLIENSKALRNLRGKGWLVVEPKDQTSVTMGDMRSVISKALQRAAIHLEYIATDMLSQGEIHENMEAKTKVGALRAFSKKALNPQKQKQIR
jgi:hypothetical protein